MDERNKLGQVTIGLETGMESVDNMEEYERQLEYVKKSKIKTLTMDEMAEKYRELHNGVNPEKVYVGKWEMGENSRVNKDLGENMVYQKGMVFKDFYQEDNSSFLNRVVNEENLIKKRLVDGRILTSGVLILIGMLLGYRVRFKWGWILIAGGVIMAERLRYSVIDGHKMIGILVDNLRFVGIISDEGIVNRDLSNLIAKSMIKIKFEYWWMLKCFLVGGLGINIWKTVTEKKKLKD